MPCRIQKFQIYYQNFTPTIIINVFYEKLKRIEQHSDDIPQKYHSNDLLNFSAIYKVQNAGNSTMFKMWSLSKLCDVYARNKFIIVIR